MSARANIRADAVPEVRIIIFDTTLRDGEQSPGCSMTVARSCEIAELLEEMGVDIIEAGFAIASRGRFPGRPRGRQEDQGQRGLLAGARQPRPTSTAPPRLCSRPRRSASTPSSPPARCTCSSSCRWTPDAVHQAVIDSVTRARSYTDDVEWCCEDGSRSEHDFLCRCIESAIDAGATTINIPDTVGYAYPGRVRRSDPDDPQPGAEHRQGGDLGALPQRPGPGRGQLAARDPGRRPAGRVHDQRHRRAGRQCRRWKRSSWRSAPAPTSCRYETRIVTQHITRASRLVSAITGFAVQPNKAIVGANAFAHEAGIHQDGMLKDAGTYEIMRPEDVGLIRSNLVMGKHSGRHAFKKKLEELGFELGDNALDEAFARFKELADKKKEIFDEDLIALVDDEIQAQRPADQVGRSWRCIAARRPQSLAAHRARDRRRRARRRGRGRRPGRRHLQRDQAAGAAHGDACRCSRSTR